VVDIDADAVIRRRDQPRVGDGSRKDAQRGKRRAAVGGLDRSGIGDGARGAENIDAERGAQHRPRIIDIGAAVEQARASAVVLLDDRALVDQREPAENINGLVVRVIDNRAGRGDRQGIRIAETQDKRSYRHSH
jgi:hypothetical protein